MQEIVVPLEVLDGWPPQDLATAQAADGPGRAPARSASDELALWRLTVACSADPALVVANDGCVTAISPRLASLLHRPVEGCIDLPLVGGLLDLLPFGGAEGDSAAYADRVPPLWSLRTASPARSLVRIRRGDGPATFDVVAAPLHGGPEDARRLIGALAFFSPLD